MARYAAAQNTLAAEVDSIDVIEVGQRVLASAFDASAFMGIVNQFRAPSRQGILPQQGALSWGTLDLDGSVSTEPDETAYSPTSRSFTCTGHYVDTVLGQYALADAATSGKPLVDQIVEEVSIGYASYFDSLFAALHTEAPSATNEVGTSSSALSGPLLDAAIEALLTAGAPENFALVIYTGKIRELMQIPGMRDRAIRGQAGAGGVDGPALQGASSKLLVRGYGGILDIYHSDQIVDSSGRHNLMFAVGDGSNGAFANPFVPVQTPGGVEGQKLYVDIAWEQARRAVEVNATTIEDAVGQNGASTTTNDWVVDVITA